jgi:hypothetical protein
MVVVRSVATRFEAELIGAKLGAHGVLWEIRSRQLVTTTHPIGWLQVLVPAEELDDAEEVLAPDPEADADLGVDRDVPPQRPRLTPAMQLLRVLLGIGLLLPLSVLAVLFVSQVVRLVDVTR